MVVHIVGREPKFFAHIMLLCVFLMVWFGLSSLPLLVIFPMGVAIGTLHWRDRIAEMDCAARLELLQKQYDGEHNCHSPDCQNCNSQN